MRISLDYIKISIFVLILSFIGVVMNPDPYMGIADYYLFFILYILLCLANGVQIKKNNINNMLGIMLVYSIVPIIISMFYGAFSTGYTFTYLTYFLLAIIIYNMPYEKMEVRSISNGYILSAIILSLWLVIQRYDYYGGGDVRHSIKFLGNTPFDPNFLAAFMVFPWIISFWKMLNRPTIRSIVSMLIIGMGIIYTSSRGAFLSILIAAYIILFEYFKDNKRAKKILMFVIVVTIVLVILERFVPNNSLERLINVSSYKDNSNAKRLLDWQIGIRAFKDSPMLGFGFQGEMSIIKRLFGISYISHNTYIAFLLQIGIIGAIVPCIFIFRLFKEIRNNAVLLGGLLSTFVVCFFISAEASVFFWLPIIFILKANDVCQNENNKYCWL